MGGEDFVNVRLSEAGAKLKKVVVHAGGTPSKDAHGMRHREFIAKPGDVLHVTRAFEWDQILAKEVDQDGKPLFEIVPADADAAAAVKKAGK